MKNPLGLALLSFAAPVVLSAQEQSADTVSLTPLLMYVADYHSAEAVAPRVEALLASTPAGKIVIDEFDRSILEATGCFGSPQLSRVLAPYIEQLPAEDMPDIAQHMALLHEMWNVLDQLALVLETVNSDETAEHAADILLQFKPFMYSWSQAVAQVQEPEADAAKRRLRMAYLVETRPRIGRLLNTWGDLALRDPEYYGSERLVEGLQDVCDVLENMGMAADPDVMPALATATRELIPLLNQWLGVISLVRDKDSADVAAVHIMRLHHQMSAVMQKASLSRVHEKDLFNVSPRFEVLAHVCDRIMHYLLEEVNPPCYGSEKLFNALQHED
ncbi:MAG: hypothetical protein E7031_00785 [Akkermansiaceae bacterium]|nr:hypothetical protein [Akkermansiaceae bacterium]